MIECFHIFDAAPFKRVTAYSPYIALVCVGVTLNDGHAGLCYCVLVSTLCMFLVKVETVQLKKAFSYARIIHKDYYGLLFVRIIDDNNNKKHADG